MKNISIGQFFPGDSVIHKMDPRAKLLLSIAIIVVLFIVKTWMGYAAVFAVLVATIIASKPLWFLILLTFVLNLFFYSGETLLVKWWIIKIYLEGVIKAITIAIRLVLLIMTTSLLTLTTSPMDITAAIESMLKPLKVVHFPVHELALMMSIALRFIPTLMEETDRIMKAQTARGASFSEGSIIARAKGIVPILVPLFADAKRTSMKKMSFTWRDLIGLIVIAALIVGLCFGM